MLRLQIFFNALASKLHFYTNKKKNVNHIFSNGYLKSPDTNTHCKALNLACKLGQVKFYTPVNLGNSKFKYQGFIIITRVK